MSYVVGVLVKPSGTSSALYQAGNPTAQADAYAAKDENGNTADRQFRDHRITVHSEFIVGANDPVPVPGDTVTFVGVNAPTVSAAGVVSGTFSVGGTASMAARVNGDVSITTRNTDYVQGSFDAVRDLVNGLP